MQGIWVLSGVAFLILLWGFANYNALVRGRNHCKEAWSNVDTELKRRYNLIPNLVETVKGYAKHESEVLEGVVRARAQALENAGSIQQQADSENALVGSLKSLFAVAEDYPVLKASQHFLELQTELANTEDRIQAARRFYNANVRDLNTRIQSFPSLILANAFNFKEAEYFRVEGLALAAAPQVQVSQ